MTQIAVPAPVSDRIHLSDFGISLHPQKHAFFQKSINYAKALRGAVGARFFINPADQILIHLNGITAEVQTEEDLYILMEIHIEGSYNLHSSRPAVILDIGMNVGFASLFFAAMPNVQRVIAFEPFPATFQQAQTNLRLNPSLAKKITPINVGVGATTRPLSLEYCDAWRGSMGIDGVPDSLRAGNPIRREIVQLRSITDILQMPELQLPPDTDLIAKIDCEGAEYEILPALANANALPKFKAILLEWHRQGPAPLLNLLQAANFTTLSQSPRNKGTGMLYAFRN